MDNRINEIRRRISQLRARMLDLETLARDQIALDLDCSEAAGQQLDIRREIVRLIGDWKAAGGGHRLPDPAVSRRVGKSKLARPGLKSGPGVRPARARNPTERGRRSVA
jgi:hypothetical protein